MIRELSHKIISGDYLDLNELKQIVTEMRSGNISDLQFVAFLSAMETRNTIKGIDVEELSNFVNALRVNQESSLNNVLCNASTGGGKFKTINIGTPAAVIIASSGVNVLKIGSRGITSNCGSSDILEAWDISLDKNIDDVIKSVDKINIGYYDFSKIVPIKGRAGLRSPLHYIGPLCNPVNIDYKILGCINYKHLETIEPILSNLCKNYLLMFNPNVDELSLTDPTHIVEKRENEERKTFLFDPQDEGLPHVDYLDILHTGEVKSSANIIQEAIYGKEGSIKDIIAANAGLGLYLSGKSRTITQGYYDAQKLIENGSAKEKLTEWRQYQIENE